MNENDLLQHVYSANRALPAGVQIPPGDDLGAMAFGGDTLLVGVDQLIGGVHFDPHTASPEQIGRKAVTRNLSDIAAMAAEPVAAVAAVTLPVNCQDAWVRRLFDATRQTAAAYHCPLIGGDIAMARGPLSLTVTVWARPGGIAPVTRRGAQPGDAIYVSGALGHSLPTGHHLDFEPRLALARALAGDKALRPRAMMDLSDGLAQDLPRMVDHAEIDAAALPLRSGPGTDAHSDAHSDGAEDRPAWQHAVGDGEDYELLLIAEPHVVYPDTVAGVPLTRVGRVTSSGGAVVCTPDGARHPLQGLGWEHRGAPQ